MSTTSGPAVGENIGRSYVLPSISSFAALLFSDIRGPPSQRPLGHSAPGWINVNPGRASGPAAGGVGQSGDAFITPENQHHVEHTRCCAAACKRGPQWTGQLAEFHAVGFGELGREGLDTVSRPRSILQLRRQFFQYTTGYIIKLRSRLLLWRDRASGKDKCRFIKKFRECLRALLEAVHAPFHQSHLCVR